MKHISDYLEEAFKECFEERSAILEFDSGMSRTDAERRAKIEVAEWLKAHRPDDEVQP